MQLTGMRYGAGLLSYVDFPRSEVLGPEASDAAIRALIQRHGEILIKPVFRGGVGKKGKAGLIGRARTLEAALREKERLYFAERHVGRYHAKATGVTFEGVVPATDEVYFSISDATQFRAPTATISHKGGVDIEDLPASDIAVVPFEALTGLKAFIIANALRDLGAPRPIISPLVQQLPKLWELFNNYGMKLLELNPIRMQPAPDGRRTPVACDFKAEFDQDDPRVARLKLPSDLFASGYSPFEQEVNQLRTYQGQSDVYVINPEADILPITFGGGASALVTELLGDDAILSSDFGGNPPYAKMRAVAEVCLRHFLRRSNVLFVIGGKANNTDIFTTFRAIADALRDEVGRRGPTPLYVLAGRGGPNVVPGMAALRDTCEALGLPYRFFGFDSEMSAVVEHARRINGWMRETGRAEVARALGVAA
ncbi:MAG: ATP citrate lyase citrate-binding domain-containing protein [Sandaracinaceae bacterium]